jgi:hypothetical protein
VGQGGAAGGTLSLVEFLRDHGEAAFADFHQYYQLDLAAIVRELRHEDEHPQPAPPRRRRWWDRFLPEPYIPPPPPVLVRSWTPAMVLALLSWLPDDSACAASMAGGKHHRGWGQDRWMRKSTFDAVQTNTIVNMKLAAGKKHRSVKAPQPWPGPDEQQNIVEKARPKTRVRNLPRLPQG